MEQIFNATLPERSTELTPKSAKRVEGSNLPVKPDFLQDVKQLFNLYFGL
jgi:hypothetical protein